MEIDRRFHPRENINIPIHYAKGYDNVYHQAITHDISMNGMSFESNQRFSYGEYFFIKIMDLIPGCESISPYDACAAQVKWCKKEATGSNYTVGIKRVGEANLIKKGSLDPSISCCELCKDSSTGELVKTDEHLYLCSNCFTQLSGQLLKENLTRFMVGNVI